jgi:hypothetical protein
MTSLPRLPYHPTARNSDKNPFRPPLQENDEQEIIVPTKSIRKESNERQRSDFVARLLLQAQPTKCHVYQ